jgi:PKD repeat protein
VVYMGGTNASSQNPQVQFNTIGAYTVALTATNLNGSNTMTKTNYINTTACSPCASTSNNATEEWISNVTFNTINNTSAGGTGYQDFTSISTNVNPGSTYSLSISCGQISTFTEHAWAFIDWNKDCDFTDAGESYDLGQVSAPGTMTLNVTVPSDALAGSTRMRASLKYNSDPTSCETFSYGQVEDYTVIVQGTSKNLTLKVYFQGLYNGAGTMIQARDATGPHFGTGIADQVTVELHNAANYGTIVSSFPNVNLSTTGDIVMNGITTVPNGSYYITIRHRNSIETTTAAPVSFTGSTITYDFSTAASQAHGNNLLNMNGVFVIYGGDANQDGLVNSSDILLIESAANGMATGYISTDINGDGLVDLTDMIPVDFNADHSISSSHP